MGPVGGIGEIGGGNAVHWGLVEEQAGFLGRVRAWEGLLGSEGYGGPQEGLGTLSSPWTRGYV